MVFPVPVFPEPVFSVPATQDCQVMPAWYVTPTSMRRDTRERGVRSNGRRSGVVRAAALFDTEAIVDEFRGISLFIPPYPRQKTLPRQILPGPMRDIPQEATHEHSIRARSFEVDANLKRESPSQT
jgi:hypothetical protein